MKKYVYFFGAGRAEGNASMRDLLGGKGANLHEMTNIGIPVPPGFTVTTEACVEYMRTGNLPEGLEEQIKLGVREVERITGKQFGGHNPLLFSVRSGARVSMPGMMDTILNIGLNDETVKYLAEATSNSRFAFDSYRRLLQMYGEVVFGIPHNVFESVLEKKKKEKGVLHDIELSEEDLKELVEAYKKICSEHNVNFPQDVWEQLMRAVVAVFESWNNERARIYRRIHNIPDDWGTAANVQCMVFGNMGEDSGTGVCFTRNPATGEKGLFGEFLINAQGEDVVAGIRTPEPIERLRDLMPNVYQELVGYANLLERHYRDMQDIEFTVEKGKLYILQTRNGKRTVRAALKIAVDMVYEGILSEREALLRVDAAQLSQLLHPEIAPGQEKILFVKGLPASPGAATGKIVLSSPKAQELAERGEKVILVRPETSPEDVGGMNVAEGIITARGGVTSHAAVVARAMGKPCIVGCHTLIVDEERGVVRSGDRELREGDVITMDGSTGEVYLGELKLVQAKPDEYFKGLMVWADRYRKLQVRANADTPEQAEFSKEWGAEGIGLCRTEHMFFQKDRINAVRKMIFAATPDERKKALDEILPMQKEDFKAIFKTMDGYPVTVRLLDPPLHEFLPKTEEEVEEFARYLGIEIEKAKERISHFKEVNPMLGLRGCRLGIVYPEIYEMQVRAIFEAACELRREGFHPQVEIMIPLVCTVREVRVIKDMIQSVAESTLNKHGCNLDYSIGTMIEVPRAAITAYDMAKEVDFFSFGTNDLTQTTLGISRDDAASFLEKYIEMGIFEKNPFVTLDVVGVGELLKIAIERGRGVKMNLKMGVCGEHGGDPETVKFLHRIGIDYVSCSPYRIPGAKLAAAQAAIIG
ncbi:pyruvate, orthophosphate dikinase [Thermosulfidibacter takaii ABI70S6]|uniref:Pyruvate, phosphate dikinase n=1 Tax=Thermosulfidibacter takaii (strain DSM 17441 / JCM 13301 / NBRC 103674 / ABI70S6) TaxID=1298851 RepID=A0A0S3QVJ1_THET7|nr:pyruvate, phosphate dikinase [Thermosulfidibacter takaii]BAT72341.1 pyruvate, orthophosphate dikinase [Thermosulfidibacter takaii ABI70S6]